LEEVDHERRAGHRRHGRFLAGEELDEHRSPRHQPLARQLVAGSGAARRHRRDIEDVVERHRRDRGLGPPRLPLPPVAKRGAGEVDPGTLRRLPGFRDVADPEAPHLRKLAGRLRLAQPRGSGSGGTSPRAARLRWTYLPITSISTLTRSPGTRRERVVIVSVWGISATSKRSAARAETVRLTPSTVTDPFSTRNGASSGGTENASTRCSVRSRRSTTRAVP